MKKGQGLDNPAFVTADEKDLKLVVSILCFLIYIYCKTVVFLRTCVWSLFIRLKIYKKNIPV